MDSYENLSGDRLLEKLVRGSANINKMKSEIALIMGMVLSFITTRGQASFELAANNSYMVRLGDYEWIFTKSPSEVWYECWLHYPLQGRIAQCLLYRNDASFSGVNMVALAHKGVGALLKSLMGDAVIREYFQPFLEASEEEGGHQQGAAGGRTETFLYQQDAPNCIDCGAAMVRNGACYKCFNCGATLGCS